MFDYRYITKIAREAEKLAISEMKAEGIGTAEADLLHYLRHNQGTTQARAREELNMEKGAAARRCESLEAKGYIRREANPVDKRSSLLYTTEKAEELKLTRTRIEDEFYAYITKGLDEAELEVFKSVLEKLYLRSKAERKSGFVNVRNTLHA